MSSARQFEDLEVWRKARTLSKTIYSLTRVGSFAKDFPLRDQINRSSGSVMDNIAEGFERGGNREFITFLSCAKGSVGEVRSQLYRCADHEHIDQITVDELVAESLHISKMLGRLMSYLQSNDFRGSKFHEPEVLYTNLSDADLEFDGSSAIEP